MIDLGYPLRHAIVVGVLRLEEKFKEASVGAGKQTFRGPIKTTICPNHAQCRVSVGDQSQANVVIREGRLRCAKNRPNKVVVEVGGAQRELSLFKRQESVVVPWGLPKYCKRKRMTLKQASVRFPCCSHMRKELWAEQSAAWFSRFKCSDSPKYLATIVSCHADGSDLCCLFIYIKIRRMTYIGTSI